MPKAVRIQEYGGIDVLRVVEVERPQPAAGEVLVQVKAAGINPGEVSVRTGALAQRFPVPLPFGQGSDLAGVVVELADGVSAFAVGDEVLGYVNTRSSQAEFAVVPVDQLVLKPAEVPWEVAGSLTIAGATAYASIEAVAPRAGETVVVSGAAGGVGSLTVQLASHLGARVIGLAGSANHAWLSDHGVIPLAYGEGVAERIQAAANGPIDVFLDTFGGGYVELALSLGVPNDRINTIIDFAAVEKYGVKSGGSHAGSRPDVLTDLAARLAKGTLELPIAHSYPLAQVQDAYRELEQRHTRGKIVLLP